MGRRYTVFDRGRQYLTQCLSGVEGTVRSFGLDLNALSINVQYICFRGRRGAKVLRPIVGVEVKEDHVMFIAVPGWNRGRHRKKRT